MPARSPSAPRPPEKPVPNPLLALIRERIRDQGHLSIAAYMELALNHPDWGYYQTREPFGTAGDFITAPEISQVFGELIGLWLATAWQDAGRPDPFRLVELGPGRGQLMADLVRATAKVPGFLDAADIHLVESSQHLRDRQRKQLPSLNVTWHDDWTSVPGGPVFLIANEFFDALPIHQLIRKEAGFTERLLITDDETLTYGEGQAPAGLLDMLSDLLPGEPGEIAEISPVRNNLARQIGERIHQEGGVALIVDYGAWVDHATGDTLQAVRDHRSADPLEAPGKTDLTSQVDFKRLGQAAAEGGAALFGPVPQGTFLRTLGIEMRVAGLLARADQQQSRDLRAALFRLTDASAMGEAFRALVLASPKQPPPPGFGEPSFMDEPLSR
ncbi:MAG: SAM-dependent methyltransferase [Pseudomonadota bacterium]